MGAGGPHDPPVYHNGKWTNIVCASRHPYGYWTARCGRCGTTINWATQSAAKAWGMHHEQGHVDA